MRCKRIRRIIKKTYAKCISVFLPSNYRLIDNDSISTIEHEIASNGIPKYLNNKWSNLNENTLRYVQSMNVALPYEYKFSKTSKKPCIYGSVYACMLYSMFGLLSEMSSIKKREWADYLDSFQSEEDGFFYDKNILNDKYATTDWWGARHLCPHIINAYAALGYEPKYEFKWLQKYYDIEYLEKWLSAADWNSAIMDDNDIDNQIMNVGVMLQWQRDFKNDEEARKAIKYIKFYLLEKINPETGLWGRYNVSNRVELCRMIQFSYHLLRIFMYDNEPIDRPERIIDLILESQNAYGGFGANLQSSACEDIDAIDILVYVSNKCTYRTEDVRLSLERALIYVLANHNADGGYVFRRDLPLVYGHANMSSKSNESSMFPTWFRTLSIAYINKVLNVTAPYTLVHCPGY